MSLPVAFSFLHRFLINLVTRRNLLGEEKPNCRILNNLEIYLYIRVEIIARERQFSNFEMIGENFLRQLAVFRRNWNERNVRLTWKRLLEGHQVAGN